MVLTGLSQSRRKFLKQGKTWLPFAIRNGVIPENASMGGDPNGAHSVYKDAFLQDNPTPPQEQDDESDPQ